MPKALFGVRGMDTPAAAAKVKETLQALDGVEKVDAGTDGQAAVTYDDSDLTVMDLIRALRRAGFQAGMV